MLLFQVGIAYGARDVCSSCGLRADTIFISLMNTPAIKTKVKLNSNADGFYAWLCMKDLRQLLHNIGWVGDSHIVKKGIEPSEVSIPFEELLVQAEIEYQSDGSSLITLVEKE